MHNNNASSRAKNVRTPRKQSFNCNLVYCNSQFLLKNVLIKQKNDPLIVEGFVGRLKVIKSYSTLLKTARSTYFWETQSKQKVTLSTNCTLIP